MEPSVVLAKQSASSGLASPGSVGECVVARTCPSYTEANES